MKLHRTLIIVGLASIGLGIAGLAPMLYYSAKNRQALAQSPTVSIPAIAPLPAHTPTLMSGKPAHLIIPSLNIDLQIADGVYNPKNGSWALSRDKAHYALPTQLANNESGNTLLYGHYRPEVFARLHKIVAGAEVTVETDNGYRFTYKFERNETVAPSDTSIFAYKGAPQLTIQTCTGTFMQNRQLFYFSFVDVVKV